MRLWSAIPCVVLIACGSVEGDPGSATEQPAREEEAPPTETSPPPDIPSPPALPVVPASTWIREHFAAVSAITGTVSKRMTVETPAIIDTARACCGKYAFDIAETQAPDDRRAALVDVTIENLESPDAYGGGLVTQKAAGLVLFLANVRIEPHWPRWQSYSTTNKDGMVLDDTAELYAEDLTITNWNADSGIDNKAPVSQFVRLSISGPGNRSIRFWGNGPHYLVDSDIANDDVVGDGVLFWFKSCATTVVRVYDSTFNGEPTVPAGAYKCESGGTPTFEYLTVDPRTTGEMHPMFAAP